MPFIGGAGAHYRGGWDLLQGGQVSIEWVPCRRGSLRTSSRKSPYDRSSLELKAQFESGPSYLRFKR